MFFNQTDKELEIGKIKNLKSVHISGITLNKTDKDIMSLLIMYENGSLCYTENEKEFPYFYSTVRRVYKEEKENDILIDDRTKRILEINENLDINDIHKKFGLNFNILDEITTFSKKAEADYNIIKYVFESMLAFIDRKVVVNDLNGVGKNFCLKYTENGLTEQKAFTLIEEDEYLRTYIFPGIFEGKKEFFITIKNINGLKIEFYDRNKTFYGELVVNDIKGTITTEVSSNEKLLYLKTDSLEELETTPYDYFLKLYDLKGKKYKLPWNNIRIYDEEEIKKEQDTHKTFIISGLDLSKDGRHIRLTTNKIERLSLGTYKHVEGKFELKTIDETSVTDIYLIGEEEYYAVAETTFMPSILSRGIYKSELEDKRFYKIYKLESLELENIDELDMNLTGVKRYQLLKENELKLIQRRGEK